MASLTWPKDYTRYTSHVPNEAYRDNWDKIFGKKDQPEDKKHDETTTNEEVK